MADGHQVDDPARDITEMGRTEQRQLQRRPQVETRGPARSTFRASPLRGSHGESRQNHSQQSSFRSLLE
jgi:hypothetical protein